MGTNMIFVRPESGQQGGVRLESSTMQSLTVDDVEAIRASCSHVSHVSPQVQGRGQAISGANNWPTSIQGVSPDFLEIRKLEVADGVMFTERDIQSAAKYCILGPTVVENLFPGGESPIGKTIRFKNIPFKVIGVLAE